MSYSRVSQELVGAIVPLYVEGQHPQAIADHVGCALSTVYAALHQEGIELSHYNRKRMEIEHVSYSDIDPIWAAEFRGFFYGDGAAMLSRVERDGNYLYKPKLMITLRQDSLPLLEDIQRHLGGSVDTVRGMINTWGYECNPTARWYTCGYANILAIIDDVLLREARLPAIKRVQIVVLREAIHARLDMPYMMSQEGKAVLDDYYIRLKELKHY